MNDTLRREVIELIARSPRLAIARAWDLDFCPYIFTVTGDFSSAGSPQAILAVEPSQKVQRDLLIMAIDVDIQTKDQDTGDVFKPQSDFFYDKTSGIQTRIYIDGYNKRTTPYFPLGAVPEMVGKKDRPWTFLEEQSLTMDFVVTTPLPSDSTIITVTYVCSTPAPDIVFRMSATEAFCELDKLGYTTKYGRQAFGCS